MDITKYNSEEIESLSYRDLQKLCKENGVRGKKKKVELMEALQSLVWYDDNEDSSVLQARKSHVSRKRGALADISVVTGNSTEPPYKIKCNKIFESDGDVGSSLFSEFQCSLQAISSTPTKLDLSDSIVIVEQENKLKKFSAGVQENEEVLRNLISRFEESAKPLLNKIESQRIELENKRCEGDNYLQKLLEHQLKEKEKALTNKYDQEIRQLKTKKELIEKKLAETDYTYKQTVKEHTDAMLKKEQQNAGLVNKLKVTEVIIGEYRSFEEERKQLKVSVEKLKKEIETKDTELTKQIELTKTIELTAKHVTIEAMEDEFTCIICQELLINAITLPCGHSFCEICLRTWFKTKKACPVCRRDIKIKAIPSVIIDSAVERIMESMDDDAKRKRVQLKRERNEQKRREDAAADPQGIRKMFHRVDGDNDQLAPTSANETNANRRRSRSQSPARNLQNRQLANQIHRAVGNNNNNNNLANRMYHTLNNQWVNNNNNNYQGNMNNQNNYQNRQFGIRCYTCGSTVHLSRDCPRRR